MTNPDDLSDKRTPDFYLRYESIRPQAACSMLSPESRENPIKSFFISREVSRQQFIMLDVRGEHSMPKQRENFGWRGVSFGGMDLPGRQHDENPSGSQHDVLHRFSRLKLMPQCRSRRTLALSGVASPVAPALR